eukprot:311822-Pyramimonas_sp.AAC.1
MCVYVFWCFGASAAWGVDTSPGPCAGPSSDLPPPAEPVESRVAGSAPADSPGRRAPWPPRGRAPP